MTDNKEDLFGQLNYGIPENMYKARCYVLKKMVPQFIEKGIKEKWRTPFHVIVDGTSCLMLSIVRQLALTMHFMNYDELKETNASVITIRCDNVDDALRELKKKEYLCNLIDFCKVSKNEELETIDKVKKNDYLPLDIIIKVSENTISDEDAILINDYDVNEYLKTIKEDYRIIDVSMAKLVAAVYMVGSDISNIPANDDSNVQRYMTAFETYCHHLNERKLEKSWNDSTVTDKLSSVFCADCFKIRVYELMGQNAIKSLNDDMISVMEKVANEIENLACHEHARWNVEKLIMGFRPYNPEEMFVYESKFKKDRKAYRKQLKNCKVHLDICSNKSLHRIDPDNVRYDVFLMLAMPEIMRRTL